MTTQKVLFIIGASKGMGLEIAKAALANGYKVISTSRSFEEVESIGKAAENMLCLKVDITKEQAVKYAISESIKSLSK